MRTSIGVISNLESASFRRQWFFLGGFFFDFRFRRVVHLKKSPAGIPRAERNSQTFRRVDAFHFHVVAVRIVSRRDIDALPVQLDLALATKCQQRLPHQL